MSIVRYNSPPLEDFGRVPSHIGNMLLKAAAAAEAAPGYVEPGRVSQRIIFGEPNGNPTLELLAKLVGQEYLGQVPAPGSTAVVSKVTDADAFNAHTRSAKVASNWHHDFVRTEAGFFYAPEDQTRLVIPIMAGPLFAVGNLTVSNAVSISTTASGELPDKHAAAQVGPTVIGTDGVLIKSEAMPTGGVVHEAESGHAFILPNNNVHKAPAQMPQGRLFFQLDAR